MDTRQEVVDNLKKVISTAQIAINALQSGVIVDRNPHLGANVGTHFLISEEIDSIRLYVSAAHAGMIRMTPDELNQLVGGGVSSGS